MGGEEEERGRDRRSGRTPEGHGRPPGTGEPGPPAGTVAAPFQPLPRRCEAGTGRGWARPRALPAPDPVRGSRGGSGGAGLRPVGGLAGVNGLQGRAKRPPWGYFSPFRFTSEGKWGVCEVGAPQDCWPPLALGALRLW